MRIPAIFKRAAAAAFLGACCAATQASIVIPSSPPVTVSGPSNLGTIVVPSILAVGDAFTTANRTFFDDFTFTVPAASFEALSASVNFGTFSNIAGFSASLYSGAIPGTSYSSGSNPFSTTPLVVGGTLPASWSGSYNMIPLTDLGSGTYTLQFTGTTGAGVLGVTAAFYAGVASLSAVPEASASALAATGMVALLALVAGRRRRRGSRQ
jgi:MYXO-CTERM domain-containing protein